MDLLWFLSVLLQPRPSALNSVELTSFWKYNLKSVLELFQKEPSIRNHVLKDNSTKFPNISAYLST